MKQIPSSIIISRTDSIGDVILTLPMAKILKDFFPHIKIAFLGRTYTRPVIEACTDVDEFIDMNDFLKKEILVDNKKPDAIIHVFPVVAIAKRAKQLQIPLRIGTTNRLYHWFTCNKLVNLSRRNSSLHEAQLNLKLLQPFGITKTFSLDEISGALQLKNIKPLETQFSKLIQAEKYNLIIHPKSQGSAREWGEENFIALINMLDENHYTIFISGTARERESLQALFDAADKKVTDITGKMDLSQFISFINQCDGLVANSTGPLHIAAALNKDAFGIFAPMHPIHPGRWAPVGKKSHVFVLNKECNDCKNNKKDCHCIKEVQALWIKEALNKVSQALQVQ
jgi:lipopolysaccharide heptosyltransferase III